MPLAALLALSLAAADAPIPPGYYRGRLGADAVSLCLEPDGDGRYYVESEGKTWDLRALPGRSRAWIASMPAHARYADDFAATDSVWWELAGSGTAPRGTWHGGTDGTRPITLERAPKTCAEGFEVQRLRLPPQPLRTETQDGVTYALTRHPVLGTVSLQIASGVAPEAMAKINAALAELAKEQNEEWIACVDAEASIQPTVTTALWLVVEANRSGFCGGAHPNEESTPVSWDRRTGAMFRAGDLLDARYYQSGKLRGALWDALLARMRADADRSECVPHFEALHASQYGDPAFTVWLGRDGVNFNRDETDRSTLTCEGDYGFDFDAIVPYVAPEQRERYAELVAAARAVR